MRYTPAGRLESRYDPWLSVTAVWPPWRAGLVADIATPGNGAPVSSTIVPNTEPFCAVSCACAGRLAHRRNALIAIPITTDRSSRDIGCMCSSTIYCPVISLGARASIRWTDRTVTTTTTTSEIATITDRLSGGDQ